MYSNENKFSVWNGKNKTVFIFVDRDIKTRQWIIVMVQLIINTKIFKIIDNANVISGLNSQGAYILRIFLY